MRKPRTDALDHGIGAISGFKALPCNICFDKHIIAFREAQITLLLVVVLVAVLVHMHDLLSVIPSYHVIWNLLVKGIWS